MEFKGINGFLAHTNRFRQALAQVGAHICPDKDVVPQLASERFYQMQYITNPIIKAIYFQQELIRIHPFVDGNGRVTRVAKNWLLMFDLYHLFLLKMPHRKKNTFQRFQKALESLLIHLKNGRVFMFQRHPPR